MTTLYRMFKVELEVVVVNRALKSSISRLYCSDSFPKFHFHRFSGCLYFKTRFQSRFKNLVGFSRLISFRALFSFLYISLRMLCSCQDITDSWIAVRPGTLRENEHMNTLHRLKHIQSSDIFSWNLVKIGQTTDY